jgi:hypothetical protein
MTNLRIDNIRADGGTQTRAELRADAIEEYADAMRNGAEFPPVDVFLDKNSHYWLADGFHRYSAAAIAEHEMIEANVHKGELRQAIWFALSANTTNGIRLTNADKRRRVEMALADKEWSGMSDNAIADHVGVSVPFVGSIRNQLLTVNSSPATETRTGRDGKKRKLPKKRRRPQPPPEPAAADHTNRPARETTKEGTKTTYVQRAKVENFLSQARALLAALSKRPVITVSVQICRIKADDLVAGICRTLGVQHDHDATDEQFNIGDSIVSLKARVRRWPDEHGEQTVDALRVLADEIESRLAHGAVA